MATKHLRSQGKNWLKALLTLSENKTESGNKKKQNPIYAWKISTKQFSKQNHFRLLWVSVNRP